MTNNASSVVCGGKKSSPQRDICKSLALAILYVIISNNILNILKLFYWSGVNKSIRKLRPQNKQIKKVFVSQN